MRILLALLLAAVPLSPAMAQTSEVAAPKPERLQALDSALTAINDHKPGDAVTILDLLLADYEQAFANEKHAIYCGHNTNETMSYLLLAASDADSGKDMRGAVVIEPGWCVALWAKGYALIDLGRVSEAVPFLERAVTMSPSHAHYLSELGHAYQMLKLWDQALDAFTRAAEGAALIQGDERTRELGRAWRGMGYSLVELGRWDEAEAVYRKCVELNPDDRQAAKELEYVAQNRPKL